MPRRASGGRAATCGLPAPRTPPLCPSRKGARHLPDDVQRIAEDHVDLLAQRQPRGRVAVGLEQGEVLVAVEGDFLALELLTGLGGGVGPDALVLVERAAVYHAGLLAVVLRGLVARFRLGRGDGAGGSGAGR